VLISILQSDTPGPGTYGKGGIPHAVIEQKNQKSTSTVGMLDAGSSTPRTLPMVVSCPRSKFLSIHGGAVV
jgi:hypothetical protein